MPNQNSSRLWYKIARVNLDLVASACLNKGILTFWETVRPIWGCRVVEGLGVQSLAKYVSTVWIMDVQIISHLAEVVRLESEIYIYIHMDSM